MHIHRKMLTSTLKNKIVIIFALFFPPFSALLYLNGDFDGGEFIFTEMDAKTVTVRKNNCYCHLSPQVVWRLKALFPVTGVSEAPMWADGRVLIWRGESTRCAGGH